MTAREEIAILSDMKRGFTLIELMIVIVIIAVLATLGGANYVTSLKRGRNAARLEDVRAIADAQEMYFGKKGQYSNAADVSDECIIGDLYTVTQAFSQIPKDPQGGNYGCYYAVETVSGVEYRRAFCVIAPLEEPYNGANCTACDCATPSDYNCTITTGTNTAYCVTNNQ